MRKQGWEEKRKEMRNERNKEVQTLGRREARHVALCKGMIEWREASGYKGRTVG
jgi:hypothetical protein